MYLDKCVLQSIPRLPFADPPSKHPVVVMATILSQSECKIIAYEFHPRRRRKRRKRRRRRRRRRKRRWWEM